MSSCYYLESFKHSILKAMDEMEEPKWLQWDSHTAHVRSLLQDLMITNNFSDVTLVCEDLTMLRAAGNFGVHLSW